MKKNNKVKLIPIITVSIIILIIVVIIALIKDNKSSINTENDDEKIIAIEKHFNSTVVTNKKSIIYTKEGNDYIEIGNVEKDTLLTLKDQQITENTVYFTITNMDDEYYIEYENVDISSQNYQKDERYRNYIVFNENVTSSVIKLYREDKLVYTIKKNLELPIYIKDDNKYYVEYSNELFEVMKNEVDVIISNNTSSENTKGIGVLNYHFFWDDKTEESNVCNQEICHSITQFKEHLDYIKNNNIFTPTMNELEMYIDEEIQLPRSVVITIDDGWRADIGIKMLNEYKLNGTLFLITGDYNPDDYASQYVELHSHTDKLHTAGQCSGGQGGGIKCLPREEIIEDLKISRDKLNGSTVLCYPFYEYNDYSIEAAKDAGFTMAFTGESSQSDNLVKVGSDKYRLPRFVVVTYTTMSDLINYIG